MQTAERPRARFSRTVTNGALEETELLLRACLDSRPARLDPVASWLHPVDWPAERCWLDHHCVVSAIRFLRAARCRACKTLAFSSACCGPPQPPDSLRSRRLAATSVHDPAAARSPRGASRRALEALRTTPPTRPTPAPPFLGPGFRAFRSSSGGRGTVAGCCASAGGGSRILAGMSRIWGHRGIPPGFSLGARPPSPPAGGDSVAFSRRADSSADAELRAPFDGRGPRAVGDGSQPLCVRCAVGRDQRTLPAVATLRRVPSTALD